MAFGAPYHTIFMSLFWVQDDRIKSPGFCGRKFGQRPVDIIHDGFSLAPNGQDIVAPFDGVQCPNQWPQNQWSYDFWLRMTLPIVAFQPFSSELIPSHCLPSISNIIAIPIRQGAIKGEEVPGGSDHIGIVVHCHNLRCDQPACQVGTATHQPVLHGIGWRAQVAWLPGHFVRKKLGMVPPGQKWLEITRLDLSEKRPSWLAGSSRKTDSLSCCWL